MGPSTATLERAHTQPDGVSFSVSVGSRKVRCFITRAALVFLAGHFILPENYRAIFSAYHDPIVNAARRKYTGAKGAKGQLGHIARGAGPIHVLHHLDLTWLEVFGASRSHRLLAKNPARHLALRAPVWQVG